MATSGNLQPVIDETLVLQVAEHIADRHSTLAENERLVIAYWIILTYFYQDCQYKGIPYLHIASTPGNCGKTEVAHILKDLSNTAEIVDPTAASLSLFRDSNRHTAIIDEISRLLNAKSIDRDTFERLLLHGNRPGISWEVVSADTPQRDTFFPKAFLGTEPGIFGDKLQSRCIRIIVKEGSAEDQRLREIRQAERRAAITTDRLRQSLESISKISELHEQLKLACHDDFFDPDIRLETRTLNDGTVLINRLADIWLPILRLADMTSTAMGKRIRDYIQERFEHEPEIMPTEIDNIDNALRQLMRDNRISVLSYLDRKRPLKNDDYVITNIDLGWPVKSIKNKLPSGYLLINDKHAELRFLARDFPIICKAMGYSRSDVIAAYKQIGRLRTQANRSSIPASLYQGQKQTSVIAINVTHWLWPETTEI
jgi:predicted transcriptional regulator